MLIKTILVHSIALLRHRHFFCELHLEWLLAFQKSLNLQQSFLKKNRFTFSMLESHIFDLPLHQFSQSWPSSLGSWPSDSGRIWKRRLKTWKIKIYPMFFHRNGMERWKKHNTLFHRSYRWHCRYYYYFRMLMALLCQSSQPLPQLCILFFIRPISHYKS